MRPRGPDKSPEEFTADIRAAMEALGGVLGTDSEDAAAQGLAEAIGGLLWRGSQAQLDDLGIHTTAGLVLVAPDPRTIRMRDAISRGDRSQVRTLLSEDRAVPPAMIDRVIASLFRGDDQSVE